MTKEKPLEEYIHACPFCGCAEVEICRTNRNVCWVRCAECGGEAESARRRADALANWNRRYFGQQLAKVIMDDEVFTI